MAQTRAPSFFPMQISYSIQLLASRVAHRLHRMALERQQILDAVRDLKRDLAQGNEQRTGYVDHYTEETEIAVRERYRRDFASSVQSEPVFRARHVRGLVERFVPQGSTVLNFGCSYGWLEGNLPNHKPVGIDRSEKAMALNREEFPHAQFVAGDVFDYLRSNRIDAFCHVNACTYFMPKFISRLYAAAREAGAKWIIAWEPSGISRQTNRYYTYDTEDRPPVVFRGPMLLNNYPRLMQDAGYALVHHEILKPPHPHRDFRSACFIGQIAL